MSARRSAFFVSDHTGITVEMLGHSLLTQFEGVTFVEIFKPFIDSADKARELVRVINQASTTDGARALVFCTLANQEIGALLTEANALVLDCFQILITPLERELGIPSSHAVGRSHSAIDIADYYQRIEAVNFAMSHDDGVSTRDLRSADIILVGVSRCGKTPTCLYLALQYGIRAANYPFIPEDFGSMRLPSQLDSLHGKLHGLTINPERLHVVRHERRPDSGYADLANCRFEIREAEALMRQEGIPYIDTTSKSIEELAATILHRANLVRHIY